MLKLLTVDMWAVKMWMTNEVGQRNILLFTIFVPTSVVGNKNGKCEHMRMLNTPFISSHINQENNKKVAFSVANNRSKYSQHLKFMVEDSNSLIKCLTG